MTLFSVTSLLCVPGKYTPVLTTCSFTPHLRQNILQHLEPPTLEGTSELQTSVSETLMITNSEMLLGIHCQILKEGDEMSNGLDIKNQGNSNQDGMVTTDITGT